MVLEIHSSASKDEIRQAYRKAALANHPDKVPEDDRPAAEIKFKAVQEAYEILYDEDKRHMYDTHGMGAFNGSGEQMAPDIDDLLAQMFGGMGGMGGMPGMGGMGGMPGGPRGKSRKSANEEQDYDVSLEEMYKGKTVKFASTKNVICSLCKGKGGKEKAKAKKCSTCDGAGYREGLRNMGQFVTRVTEPCTTCNGAGEFFSPKDKCKKCKGSKTCEEKKMLEIYIAPGSREGEKIVLEGEADQHPDQEPGDIVFSLVEEEHPVFTRRGADLQASIEITLAEALTGFSRVVLKHLDGRGIEITHPAGKILTPAQLLVVRGEGMPIKRTDSRGDLYLVVDIKFPDENWKQTPAILDTIREVLPKPDEPIAATTVDEVEFELGVDFDQFGGNANDDGWENEEDDDEEGQGAQCTTQ